MAEGESLHHGMKSLGDLQLRLHMSFSILVCRDTKSSLKDHLSKRFLLDFVRLSLDFLSCLQGSDSICALVSRERDMLIRSRLLDSGGLSIDHAIANSWWVINHQHLFLGTFFELVLVLDLSAATTKDTDEAVGTAITWEIEAFAYNVALHPHRDTRDEEKPPGKHSQARCVAPLKAGRRRWILGVLLESPGSATVDAWRAPYGSAARATTIHRAKIVGPFLFSHGDLVTTEGVNGDVRV